jgi:beta-lactamase class A
MSFPLPHTARRTTGVLLASVAALLTAGIPAAAASTAPAPAKTAPALAKSAPAPAENAPAPAKTAHATAAVLDLDGHGRAPVVHGADTSYDTASIVKVDILAALMLKAQDAHRALTAGERQHAEPMIERSDNAAADALWREIGRAPGLAAANKRLGLTSTTGGAGGLWGLTQTTASDQIRLLGAVFDNRTAKTGSDPLSARSRAYMRDLMSHVVPEQAWGVSAVNASGAQRALKNGWLQRTSTGLWDVNSVGQVNVNGHRCLVAVLSNGSASMNAGISLVERTAREAVA